MRGDGPFLNSLLISREAFSPRAWGWSAMTALQHFGNCVFPTCVGMVRSRAEWLEAMEGFPHVRGDGPVGFLSVSLQADHYRKLHENRLP